MLRAGLVVGVAHLVFKFAGVLQAMVMTRYVDRGVYDVVYAFAFEGCIFTLFLLGEEVIGPTFLPVFMREREKSGEKAAWSFANTMLTVQFVLLLVLVLLLMSFPAVFVRVITLGAWTDRLRPEEFAMGQRVLFIMAPALIAFSLGSTTYMLLNGYKRFFLAAFADASWKFCVLAAVLLGMGLLGVDYRAIVYGILAGSVAKLGTHLAGLRRELHRFRPSLALSNPAVRRMALLMLPLIGGIVFAKVRDVFNNVSILSRLETEGLLMANSLGRKLYIALGWMIPYALSIAMFPFFCEM